MTLAHRVGRVWPEGVLPMPIGDTPAIRAAQIHPVDLPCKADPIWDIQRTTKFSRKPKPDAPLVTPTGTAKILVNFLDKVAELQYLIDTQHLPLATTRQVMNANGIPSISLDSTSDDNQVQVDENNLAAAPYTYDPILERRIEWERFMFACGPVHRVFFTATKDGKLGIGYDGPAKKDVEFVNSLKKHAKTAWLASHASLPTVEEIEDANAFLAYYKKPVLAIADLNDLHLDRLYHEDEDPDPYRLELHALEGTPISDIGYGGPKGTLGIDMDNEPESGEEFAY